MTANVRAAYWVIFGLIFLVACDTPHAENSSDVIGEKDVKLAIERATELDICPDQTLLKLSRIEMSDCKAHLKSFAPICWSSLDALDIEYNVRIGEAGKERFFDITVVYSACVRSELLKAIVDQTRKQSAPQL